MTRSLSAAPVQARGGIGMTIALALVATGLIGWVLAGTPGLGGADATPDPAIAPVIAPVNAPAPVVVPVTPEAPRAIPPPAPTRPDPEPEPHVPTPEDREAVQPPPPPPAPAPAKKPESTKKKPHDPATDEPVNFDIEDDPVAPTEVSPTQIDETLRPLRPAAAECGKKNGVPLGTDIGVKMLLAADGKLVNVRPTDRPASDPAVQCIVDLVKGAKVEQPGRTKFTSAFFDYSFKVY